MTWTLMLFSAFTGGMCVKLADFLFRNKTNGADHALSSSICLLNNLVSQLHAQIDDANSIRSQAVDVLPANATKIMDDLVQLLTSQVKANEHLMEQLLKGESSRRQALGRAEIGLNGRNCGKASEKTALTNERKNLLAEPNSHQIAPHVSPTLRGDSLVLVSPTMESAPVGAGRVTGGHSEHRNSQFGAIPAPGSNQERLPSASSQEQCCPRSWQQPSTVAPHQQAACNTRLPDGPPQKEPVFHPYSASGFYAPCIAGQLPWSEGLVPMKCHELGESGILFFVEELPDFDTLVVRLPRRDGDPVDMMARVLEVNAYGQNQLLVKCEFTGRAYL